MSEKFKNEWVANSDWLKLSFHSLYKKVLPYEKTDYEEIFVDCMKVQKEIVRFAGEESLGKTSTIHYCNVTKEGLSALLACGVQGLLGLYGTIDNPKKSYQTSELENFALRNGKFVLSSGITYANIDIVLNEFEIEDILSKLETLSDRSIIKIMIHEQYFYNDYFRYQRNFQEKLEQTFSFLVKKGFRFQFFEDLLD